MDCSDAAGFLKTDRILQAYEHIQQEDVAITDDASAMEVVGNKVALIDGGIINMKITHPHDWEVIELLLNRSKGLKIAPKWGMICVTV